MTKILIPTVLLLMALANPVAAGDVNDVKKILIHSPSTTGHFVQEKKLSILTKPLVSHGEFSLVENLGIVWNVTSPVASRLVITKERIQFSDRAPSDTQRTMKHVANLLMLILGGNLEEMEDMFSITKVEVNQSNDWILELSPRNSLLKKFLTVIKLSGREAIESIYLEETSGDFTRLTLLDTEHFDPVPEKILGLFKVKSDPP